MDLGAYSTHNAAWPMRDMTWGSLSDYMKLPLVPQKASYYLVTQAVVISKTCTHTCITGVKLVELRFK